MILSSRSLRPAMLLGTLLLGALLAGCATTPASPPGTVVPEDKAAQVQAGVTTRTELLARLGPTTSIRFDNGVEVWRYLLPATSAQASAAGYGEYVVVIDSRGVVARTKRAPVVYQIPVKN